MEFSTPTNANHIKSDLTAAANTKIFAMNPANGGIPANDNSAISIAKARNGFRLLRPEYAKISSDPTTAEYVITIPNAAKLVII